MQRKLFYFLILIIAIFSSAGFSSCSKDADEPDEITDVNHDSRLFGKWQGEGVPGTNVSLGKDYFAVSYYEFYEDGSLYMKQITTYDDDSVEILETNGVWKTFKMDLTLNFTTGARVTIPYSIYSNDEAEIFFEKCHRVE